MEESVPAKLKKSEPAKAKRTGGTMVYKVKLAKGNVADLARLFRMKSSSVGEIVKADAKVASTIISKLKKLKFAKYPVAKHHKAPTETQLPRGTYVVFNYAGRAKTAKGVRDPANFEAVYIGSTTQMPELLKRAAVDSGKIKFGEYIIAASPPTAEAVKSNVAASGQALERVAKRLAEPGFSLAAPPDVPLYFADQNDPKLVVRRLHGKEERGHFVDGKFRTLAADGV
jgi:hypothetical protein